MERVRDFAQMEKRRHLAVGMIRKRKRQADVARHFCVSRASVCRWVKAHERRGRAGLAQRKHPGGEPRLKPQQRKRLLGMLLKGATSQGFSTEYWTRRRIAWLIAKEFGVRYHPAYVSQMLGSWGWSYQKPAKRARERDERRIQRWRREDYARLKKKRAG